MKKLYNLFILDVKNLYKKNFVFENMPLGSLPDGLVHLNSECKELCMASTQSRIGLFKTLRSVVLGPIDQNLTKLLANVTLKFLS